MAYIDRVHAALWARILRNKYFAGTYDFDMFKAKYDSLDVRRGITKNIDLLRKGISMAIGNDSGTLL